MPVVTRKSLLVLALLATTAVVVVIGFLWSGLYNVGADDPHTRPVYAAMEMLRKRSIAARAGRLEVPDLAEAARITQGAGNYDAMCTGCHLRPGMGPTELSRGLYPAPPDLTRAKLDAGQAFWVIKHGIKASGMPAWGKSMEDAYIWNMVAFLRVLPSLAPAEYEAMVARSGGHSHGGGESRPHGLGDANAGDPHDMPAGSPPPAEQAAHAHPPGAPRHDDGAVTRQRRTEGARDEPHPPVAPDDHHAPAASMVEHRHADGTVESHPAPPEPKADDGHDHQH